MHAQIEEPQTKFKSVSAIAWHDTRNLPPADTPFCVGVSDVTNGITDRKSGFSKLSSCSLLTPFHEAFLIVSSLLRKEDARTFEFELQLMIKVYPSIKYDKLTLLADGDKAKKTIKHSMNFEIIRYCFLTTLIYYEYVFEAIIYLL